MHVAQRSKITEILPSDLILKLQFYVKIVCCGSALGKEMSRGHFQPKTHPGTVLGRCSNKSNADKGVIFDVDEGEIDNSDGDVPESSHRFSSMRPKGKFSSSFVIRIEDEESGGDSNNKNADSDATSKIFSSSYIGHFQNDDECVMFDGHGKTAHKFSKSRNPHSANGPPGDIFDLDSSSKSSTSSMNNFENKTSVSPIPGHGNFVNDLSDSDSSDCEIMSDSFGNIRREWEKAASKKKTPDIDYFASDVHMSTSGSNSDSRDPFCETTEKAGVNDASSTSFLFSKKLKRSSLDSSPKTSDRQEPCNVFENTSKCKRSSDCFDDTSTMSGRANMSSNAEEEINIEIASAHREAVPEKQSFCFNGWSENGECFENSKSGISGRGNTGNGSPHHNVSRTKLQCSVKGDSEKSFPSSQQFNISDLQGSIDVKNTNSDVFTENQSNINYKCDIHFVPEVAQLNCHGNSSCGQSTMHASDEEQQKTTQTDISEPPECIKPGVELSGTCTLFTGNAQSVSKDFNCLIGEREKHKLSDEYKQAEAEEWAARQQQLKIQAEEVQKLRRRKRAESMRLLDMEKRQRQRVEEVRESQKKDEETINLKEKYRADVRKQLDKMEFLHRDMPSLLRGLGIHVSGGPFPLPHEINAAYKQALLKFHPDRTSRSDIRQQVEAEEKFKLISRLKERLLLVTQ